jgi:hypothetical protein
MTVQSAASAKGQLPISIQLSDVPWRATMNSSSCAGLLAMYDVQKFLNKAHIAINSHILARGSVPEHVVDQLEDDLRELESHISPNQPGKLSPSPYQTKQASIHN